MNNDNVDNRKIKTEICCIFNLAALYRAPIYKLMDTELSCDFYITEWEKPPFKQMNYSDLKGFKKTLKYKKIYKNFYWQKAAIFLVFKPYTKFILIGEPYCISTWVILIVAKILGKKTYIWTHGWYGRESKIKKIIKKSFFRMSTKVLLYGNYAKNLIINEGVQEDKLVCVFNSLDHLAQLKIRKQLFYNSIFKDYFKNNDPTLIFVGRLQKSKKIEQIIETIYLLKTRGVKCNLVIVGKDDENLNLNSLISSYGIDKQIWLYGECYDELKIGELFFNSHVCVSPGNIGLTAMHSFVFGTPVITHNNFKNQMPEFEVIEDNVTGSFFNENSVENLTEKIKYWISKDTHERKATRTKCQLIIDEIYNPYYQIEIFKKTLK